MEVFFGAVSALCGVAISEAFRMLRAHQERRHVRAILMRVKYEELASLHNQTLTWADELLAAENWVEVRSRAQASSARGAYVLALIYFPALRAPLMEYMGACLELTVFIQEAFDREAPGSAGAQAARFDQRRLVQVHEQFRAARQHVDEAIEKHAPSYAAA